MCFRSAASTLFLVFTLIQVGCAPKNTGNRAYPLFGPAMEAALPHSVASPKGAHLLDLPTGGMQGNFFGNGAASIKNILTQIDNVIANINQNAGATCNAVTPVQYPVDVFSGTVGSPRTIEMYGQCSVSIPPAFSGDPGVFIIGTQNGVTSVWMASGSSRTLAQEDSLGNIHIIYGVGYSNGAMLGCNNLGNWDACSYAVSEIQTNINWSATNQQWVLPAQGAPLLEMTVAGMGVGYCGIQMTFDGTNVYAMGSAEDVSQTCDAPASGCYLASDFSAAAGGVCDAGQSGFNLVPIGREQATGTYGSTWAASQYPALTGNVVLNGGPDPANPDALHFGGSVVAPSGVTELPYGGPSPSPFPSPVVHLPFAPGMDPSIQVDAVFTAEGYPNAAHFDGPHSGIHYSPVPGSTTPVSYYAMAPGTITMLQVHYNSTMDAWNVNVDLQITPGLRLEYLFEPNASGTSILEEQMSATTSVIPQAVKQSLLNQAEATYPPQQSTFVYVFPSPIPVNQGDLIGSLVQSQGAAPTLHISTDVYEGPGYISPTGFQPPDGWEQICGDPYLANNTLTVQGQSVPDAYARTHSILNADDAANPTIRGDWQICQGTYY